MVSQSDCEPIMTDTSASVGARGEVVIKISAYAKTHGVTIDPENSVSLRREVGIVAARLAVVEALIVHTLTMEFALQPPEFWNIHRMEFRLRLV